MPIARVVTFGETMVQYNAKYQGPYKDDGEYVLDSAGAESNVAVNLMKILPELETCWISRLGCDEAGSFILKELADRTNVVAERYTGEFTGISYLNHFEDGRHVKSYSRQGSAASRLTFKDIEPELKSADLLHVTGITPSLSESCLNTVFTALRYSKNQNIPVSFDLNYREQLWSPQSAKSVFNEIIPYASMLKVGHDEAERIWANNWNPEEYARYFHGITGALVVITQNEKGAIAFDGTNLIESLGYKVSVVDPVGAGDAFTAGMLALILQQGGLKSFFELDTKVCEKLLSEAIDVGNICGALTCTKRGDTAAMPTMDQVLDFKKIRKLD